LSHAASSSPAAPAKAAASSAAVRPRLFILTPGRGASTGQSLTVRVGVSGARPGGPGAFRYLLDGRIARLGSDRLTYHELAPGAHRVVVMLADDGRVRAGSFFRVRAPTPVIASEPAPPTTTATPAPETPATSTPAPSRTTTQRSTPAPAPPPREAPPTGGIPQNNGGDHDSDNNGGPSDGDGNV
jgi:hypothetical protein